MIAVNDEDDVNAVVASNLIAVGFGCVVVVGAVRSDGGGRCMDIAIADIIWAGQRMVSSCHLVRCLRLPHVVPASLVTAALASTVVVV